MIVELQFPTTWIQMNKIQYVKYKNQCWKYLQMLLVGCDAIHLKSGLTNGVVSNSGWPHDELLEFCCHLNLIFTTGSWMLKFHAGFDALRNRRPDWWLGGLQIGDRRAKLSTFGSRSRHPMSDNSIWTKFRRDLFSKSFYAFRNSYNWIPQKCQSCRHNPGTIYKFSSWGFSSYFPHLQPIRSKWHNTQIWYTFMINIKSRKSTLT